MFVNSALPSLSGPKLLRALEFSALTFAGNVPPVVPVTTVARVSAAMSVESLSGIVFIGVLAAAAYRWISLRQGR
jgi:hypothetical protein